MIYPIIYNLLFLKLGLKFLFWFLGADLCSFDWRYWIFVCWWGFLVIGRWSCMIWWVRPLEASFLWSFVLWWVWLLPLGILVLFLWIKGWNCEGNQSRLLLLIFIIPLFYLSLFKFFLSIKLNSKYWFPEFYYFLLLYLLSFFIIIIP